MREREEILNVLMEVIGEEGCGISCKEAEVFKDEEGWKLSNYPAYGENADYDTSDLCTFVNDFQPGKIARKTFVLPDNVRFIKVIVENQDKSELVMDVKVIATLKG